MQSNAEKANGNEPKSISNAIDNVGKSAQTKSYFEDNRPEAVTQRKQQQMMNDSPRSQSVVQRQTMAGQASIGNGGVIQLLSDGQTAILHGFEAGLQQSAAAALKALSKSETMDDFRAVVNEIAPADVNLLMQQAVTEEGLIRREVQPYIEWFGELRNELVASGAEALEGKLNWITSGAGNAGGRVVPKSQGRGKDADGYDVPGLDNAFTRFLKHETNEPPQDDSNMNCWEACLYAGFKAGVFHPRVLYNIYEIAKGAGQAKMDADMGGAEIIKAYGHAMGVVLGAGDEQWQTGDGPIPRGHLVFFNGHSHVAVSRGNLDEDDTPAVMSLWYMPGPKPNMQATSIGKILDAANDDYTISYGPPPM